MTAPAAALRAPRPTEVPPVTAPASPAPPGPPPASAASAAPQAGAAAQAAPHHPPAPHGEGPFALARALPALQLVPTPRGARRAARALAVAFAALPFALLLTPWQQSVVGSGRVAAWAALERQQRVEAPIDGRVVRWAVQEGAVVRKGETIVELADNDPALLDRLREQRLAAEARLLAARARVESTAAQVGALDDAGRLGVAAADDRLRMARERVTAAEHAVAAAEAAAVAARLHAERQRALAPRGVASRRTLELAEADLERAAAEVERAQATVRAAAREVASLEADRDRTAREAQARVDAARAARQQAEADEASARGELARVEVLLARQQTQVVVAPADGTIVRLLAAQGTVMVKAGDPLALLVPSTAAPAVELWIDGNDAPLVREGRPVRLQFEGWPAVQFVGWPSVAVGTFGGRVGLVDVLDDGHGRFRLLVVPDPQDAPWPEARYLRQGVRAKGWVLLDQVSLGYELWRQLNGFPPTVIGSSPKDGAPRDVEPRTGGDGAPGKEKK